MEIRLAEDFFILNDVTTYGMCNAHERKSLTEFIPHPVSRF